MDRDYNDREIHFEVGQLIWWAKWTGIPVPCKVIEVEDWAVIKNDESNSKNYAKYYWVIPINTKYTPIRDFFKYWIDYRILKRPYFPNSSSPGHALVAGIEAFFTYDEAYEIAKELYG